MKKIDGQLYKVVIHNVMIDVPMYVMANNPTDALKLTLDMLGDMSEKVDITAVTLVSHTVYR